MHMTFSNERSISPGTEGPDRFAVERRVPWGNCHDERTRKGLEILCQTIPRRYGLYGTPLRATANTLGRTGERFIRALAIV